MSETKPANLAIFQWHTAMRERFHSVGKDSQGHGYKFRGVDAALLVAGEIARDYGLVILPKFYNPSTRTIVHEDKSKKPTHFASVQLHLTVTSVVDGSEFVISGVGDACDVQDKAMNKAMSNAYKYAIFLGATLPTDDLDDADFDNPMDDSAPSSSETNEKKAEKKVEKKERKGQAEADKATAMQAVYDWAGANGWGSGPVLDSASNTAGRKAERLSDLTATELVALLANLEAEGN